MSSDKFADRLVLDSDPSEADMELLEDRINQFNVVQTQVFDFQRLAFVVRAADGTIVAGVAGWTWGGGCAIRSLWVDEAWRGRKFGQRLLQMAEREAAARGCVVVVLDTHSFQAPGFYRKQGYALVGIVEDYPRGHQQYYFQKRIRESEDRAAQT